MIKKLRHILALALCSICVAASALAADRTLMLAASNNADHPQNVGAVLFSNLVERRTQGRIHIKVYHGNVLGNDAKVLQGLQAGTIDMMVGTTNFLAATDFSFAVFEFPYLFNSAEEADYILDGPIGKELFARLPKHNVVGLAYYELGFRSFHTRAGKPIRNADEFSGKKLRTQPSTVYIDAVRAFGANPTPMGVSEAYTAIETGAIDGMSDPLINILDRRYYEICANLAVTNHIYQPSWLGMSKKTWDSLSASDQEIIRTAAQESAIFHRKINRETDAHALAALRKVGMTVTVFSAAERNKLKHKAEPVIAKHVAAIGPDLVSRVYSELDKFRKVKRQ